MWISIWICMLRRRWNGDFFKYIYIYIFGMPKSIEATIGNIFFMATQRRPGSLLVVIHAKVDKIFQ